jgi:hypothetical protein
VFPFLYIYQFGEYFHQMHHSYKLVMVRLQILKGTDSYQIFGCWILGRWVMGKVHLYLHYDGISGSAISVSGSKH